MKRNLDKFNLKVARAQRVNIQLLLLLLVLILFVLGAGAPTIGGGIHSAPLP
jgi:hypothetical protein